MNEHTLALMVYRYFHGLLAGGAIPVNLQAPSLVGTVQDDPFDTWVASEIKQANPAWEVFQAGKLTTPDIIVRDAKSKCIGAVQK